MNKGKYSPEYVNVEFTEWKFSEKSFDISIDIYRRTLPCIVNMNRIGPKWQKCARVLNCGMPKNVTAQSIKAYFKLRTLHFISAE